jgi:hypothetical protein
MSLGRLVDDVYYGVGVTDAAAEGPVYILRYQT